MIETTSIFGTPRFGYHTHSDLGILLAQLRQHGWVEKTAGDHAIWWSHELHGELGIELPTAEPHESVTCWFVRFPTRLVLEQLRFPLG